MCAPDNKTTSGNQNNTDLPPHKQESSASSSSSSSSTTYDSDHSLPSSTHSRQLQRNATNSWYDTFQKHTHTEMPGNEKEVKTWTQAVQWTMGGIAVGLPVAAFSLEFPLLLFPKASVPTYQPAAYQYDPDISFFDNTLWTYGTDYLIAVAMMWQIMSFPKPSSTKRGQQGVQGAASFRHNRIAKITFRSQALLASYATSVWFGGLCHQFYTTTEMRQTWHFRLLWTICVGFVTVAPGFMGAIATELVRQDAQLGLALLPAIPAWFWTGFGSTVTAATTAGYFSFQRPACDIFVAGVTQFPSTFYLMTMLAFGLPSYANISRATRYAGLVGFILMSVTLPSYPLAVQYTDLSLGQVNGILHVVLLTAWSLQGTTLRRICQAFQEANGPPFPVPSVPVKRTKVL